MATDRRSNAVDDTAALATTIGLSVRGEISVGKAAERTGVTRWELAEILYEAGVALRLGPQSMAELEAGVDVALGRE